MPCSWFFMIYLYISVSWQLTYTDAHFRAYLKESLKMQKYRISVKSIICESVHNLHNVWKRIHVLNKIRYRIEDCCTICINWNVQIPNPNWIRQGGGLSWGTFLGNHFYHDVKISHGRCLKLTVCLHSCCTMNIAQW